MDETKENRSKNKEYYEKMLENDPEFKQRMEGLSFLHPIIYDSDNNFAYNKDTNTEWKIIQNSKMYNFVPTYDPWCLACDKEGCKKKCGECKSVYFCNKQCQKKAWHVHKKHCGNDLFKHCIQCGKIPNTKVTGYFKCPKCPIKICSENCKSVIYKTHQEFDCDYFSKTFGEYYLNFS